MVRRPGQLARRHPGQHRRRRDLDAAGDGDSAGGLQLRCRPARTSLGVRHRDRPGANNVFIGTNCGVAISTDSGATWTFVDPTPATAAGDVWDVVVADGGIVDICGDDGHLRSTDGGVNWTADAGLGIPGGRCSIAASPDESYVLFVVAGDNNVYETDNAGTNWTNHGSNGPRAGSRSSSPTSARTRA